MRLYLLSQQCKTHYDVITRTTAVGCSVSRAEFVECLAHRSRQRPHTSFTLFSELSDLSLGVCTILIGIVQYVLHATHRILLRCLEKLSTKFYLYICVIQAFPVPSKNVCQRRLDTDVITRTTLQSRAMSMAIRVVYGFGV